MDTSVVWSGALSPLSNAAQLGTISELLDFYTPSTVWAEVASRLNELNVAPAKAKAVDVLVERYLNSLDHTPMSAPRLSLPGDPALKATAHDIDAVVCTYNVRHFPHAVTPEGLLREADFVGRNHEHPPTGSEGTIVYRLRLWSRDGVRILFRFADGTTVRGDDDGHLVLEGGPTDAFARSKRPLPLGQTFGLVIRFGKPVGRIRADAWHWRAEHVKGGQWQTDHWGNMFLFDQRLGDATDLRIETYNRTPFTGEGFGVSAAPTWLGDESIALAMRVETLEASVKSEWVRQLVDAIEVSCIGDYLIVRIDAVDVATKYLPGRGRKL